MKVLRFIALALLIQTCAFAQSNYKPGLVIQSSGDTLKGFINYKEWENNPPYVEFKTIVANKEHTKFYPGMLRGFEVSGMDKYISYTGHISMDKNTLPDLASGLDTSSVLDTVFLRTEYEGSPLSLLTHQDNLKLRIFVQDGDKAPFELKYYQYYTDGNAFSTKDKFKIQILLLAQKYNWNNDINKAIENVKFRTNELERLLKVINKDSGHKSSYEVNGSRFFAGIALNRTVTQFDGENTFSGMPYTSYLPRISAGYDIFANRFTQKLILRAELAFGFVKPRFTRENNSIFSDSQTGYQFDQYTLTFTPQIIYNIYNAEALKVFIGGGASFNYSIYSNNQQLRGESKVAYPNFYNLTKVWMSFPVQVGVTLNKKLEISAQYTSPTAYTQYINFSISNKIYGVGVRYLFK